jgi:hypothetical protein
MKHAMLIEAVWFIRQPEGAARRIFNLERGKPCDLCYLILIPAGALELRPAVAAGAVNSARGRRHRLTATLDVEY